MTSDEINALLVEADAWLTTHPESTALGFAIRAVKALVAVIVPVSPGEEKKDDGK